MHESLHVHSSNKSGVNTLHVCVKQRPDKHSKWEFWYFFKTTAQETNGTRWGTQQHKHSLVFLLCRNPLSAVYQLVTQVTLKVVLLPGLGKAQCVSYGSETHCLGKTQTWSVARVQRQHNAQGIQSVHPFINSLILLAITLTSQKITM